MELLTWVRAQWDRCLAWVLIVAGVVVLILGWVGVSRYAYPADQLPYIISGGIGGLLLVGLGAMFWLSADLRDEWRMLRRIDAALREKDAVALLVEETDGSQFGLKDPFSRDVLMDHSDDPTAENEMYVGSATAMSNGSEPVGTSPAKRRSPAAKRQPEGDAGGAASQVRSRSRASSTRAAAKPARSNS
jgi:hypothetical protein